MSPRRLRLAAVTLAVAASTLLLVNRSAVFAASPAPALQGPPAGGPPPGGMAGMNMAPPANLKVLPKDMTNKQVHEIMDKWSADLGTGCNGCHTADTKNLGPNGRPRMNFADDSKEEKLTARKMYEMTEKLNVEYIAKLDSAGLPVTCGTCHRGHMSPEAFVPPKRENGPGGPPPGGPPPPAGR